jgi:hypothetical protein
VALQFPAALGQQVHLNVRHIGAACGSPGPVYEALAVGFKSGAHTH